LQSFFSGVSVVPDFTPGYNISPRWGWDQFGFGQSLAIAWQEFATLWQESATLWQDLAI